MWTVVEAFIQDLLILFHPPYLVQGQDAEPNEKVMIYSSAIKLKTCSSFILFGFTAPEAFFVICWTLLVPHLCAICGAHWMFLFCFNSFCVIQLQINRWWMGVTRPRTPQMFKFPRLTMLNLLLSLTEATTWTLFEILSGYRKVVRCFLFLFCQFQMKNDWLNRESDGVGAPIA